VKGALTPASAVTQITIDGKGSFSSGESADSLDRHAVDEAFMTRLRLIDRRFLDEVFEMGSG
jgi:hypothetical protein